MKTNKGLAHSMPKLFRTGSIAPVFIMLGCIWLLSILVVPEFFTINRTMQLLQTASFLAIAAAGQTVSVITNGIDYSVSGVITISACVCGALLTEGFGTFWAVLITLIMCVIIGFVNSQGIYYLKIPTLIMTIATVTILEGAALIGTGGYAKNGQSEILQTIGQGRLFGVVPYMLFVLLYIYYYIGFYIKQNMAVTFFPLAQTKESVYFPDMQLRKLEWKQ